LKFSTQTDLDILKRVLTLNPNPEVDCGTMAVIVIIKYNESHPQENSFYETIGLYKCASLQM